MRSRSRGKTLLKFLGALAGLVFMVCGFKFRADITSFQRHGKFATVESIDKYTEFKQGSNSTYTAEVHFKTQDGRGIVQKHSFPEEALADFKAGSPVQIIYLPDDPSTFIFAREEPGWWLIIGGLALAVASLLFA